MTPVAAAGVLAAHALAYRLTGARPGPMHEYLAHVPQVVAVLASIAVVGLAVQERSPRRLSARWVAPLAPLGFACQEHLERLVHEGHVPWLLTTPTFLAGIALQLPVALACVLLVRRVVGALPGLRQRRSARLGEAWLPLSESAPLVRRAARPPRAAGRSPPVLVAS